MNTTEQSGLGHERWPRWSTAALGLVLLAAAVLALLRPALDWLQRSPSLESLTPLAIRVSSTLSERALLFLITWLFLGVGVLVTARRSRAVYLLLCLSLFLALFYLGARQIRLSHLAASLLLTAPLAVVTSKFGSATRLGSESPDGSGIRPAKRWRAARGVTVGCAVAAVAVLLPHEHGLLQLRSHLLPDRFVEQFARGDFNWIELSRDRGTLYAAGHGVSRLRAYDTSALNRPPKQAAVGTGGAQSFAYDPAGEELYLFNPEEELLYVLDSATLEVRRSFPVPEVTTGDSWVLWHAASRQVLIVSEADVERGDPFVVVDGVDGKILGRHSWAPGNVLLDPRRPVVYLSFFRGSKELLAYDLEKGQITRSGSADRRSDRMAFLDDTDELLLASPLRSLVQRFDARTLERKGDLKSIFGVRSLAVDSARGLLACASLATTTVAFVDFANGDITARHSVAPWLRTIRLDPAAGVAYVSSKSGLFKLDYAKGLQPS